MCSCYTPSDVAKALYEPEGADLLLILDVATAIEKLPPRERLLLYINATLGYSLPNCCKLLGFRGNPHVVYRRVIRHVTDIVNRGA